MLHAIIMTGAIPVFLMPTRNHFGIIGPIPKSEFGREQHPEENRRQSLCRRFAKPRVLTITQSTYDGVILQRRGNQEMLDGKIDTLAFR